MTNFEVKPPQLLPIAIDIGHSIFKIELKDIPLTQGCQ